MRSTFFGVLSGPIVGLVLLLFAFLNINVLFWDDLGATPFYWWVLFVTLFLGCVVLFESSIQNCPVEWDLPVRGGSLLCILELHAAMVESIAVQRITTRIIDWRNSSSLAWLLHFPFTVMVITAQGAVFDLLRSKGAHIIKVLGRAS